MSSGCVVRIFIDNGFEVTGWYDDHMAADDVSCYVGDLIDAGEPLTVESALMPGATLVVPSSRVLWVACEPAEERPQPPDGVTASIPAVPPPPSPAELLGL